MGPVALWSLHSKERSTQMYEPALQYSTPVVAEFLLEHLQSSLSQVVGDCCARQGARRASALKQQHWGQQEPVNSWLAHRPLGPIFYLIANAKLCLHPLCLSWNIFSHPPSQSCIQEPQGLGKHQESPEVVIKYVKKSARENFSFLNKKTKTPEEKPSLSHFLPGTRIWYLRV